MPPTPSDDYDYRAATLAGVRPGPNGHWPDTYKLPNHITFSTDSKYHKPGQEGGVWSEKNGKWHYKPSAFVLRQHGADKLKKYFAENEKDSVLELEERVARDSDLGQKAENYADTYKSLTGGAMKGFGFKNKKKAVAPFVKPKNLVDETTEKPGTTPAKRSLSDRMSYAQSKNAGYATEKTSSLNAVSRTRESRQKRYDKQNADAFNDGVRRARQGNFAGMDDNQRRYFTEEVKKRNNMATMYNTLKKGKR